MKPRADSHSGSLSTRGGAARTLHHVNINLLAFQQNLLDSTFFWLGQHVFTGQIHTSALRTGPSSYEIKKMYHIFV